MRRLGGRHNCLGAGQPRVTGARPCLPLDVMDAYVGRLAQDYRSDRELKVVWMQVASAAPALLELVQRLPGHHVVMHEEVDGTLLIIPIRQCRKPLRPIKMSGSRIRYWSCL